MKKFDRSKKFRKYTIFNDQTVDIGLTMYFWVLISVPHL